MQTTYLDLLASNRIFGIEYAIGAVNHPKHQLSKVNKKKIISGLNDFFDHWLKQIQKKKIKVFISAEKNIIMYVK